MSLTDAIRLLQQARENAHKECLRLDAALAALGSLHGSQSPAGSKANGRKRMSMAARQRIAAAQRHRWKLWKASKQQGKKAA
jgi:hypothetical protein